MAVRLVVTFHATPGKGAELTQAMKARCEISRQVCRRNKGRRQGCGHVPAQGYTRARDRQPGQTDQDSRDARAPMTTGQRR
jgi:hypothetical protein